MKGSHRGDCVVARAPGKVNVCFRVGREQTDGSHVIATMYQAVSLFDTVYAYDSDDFTLEMLGASDEIPGGERNLAMRAAKLLALATDYRGGVHLEIDKAIPRGSGMSGGSADAAAALVACNDLWELGLDRAHLSAIALELGADVPFALEGGTAIGTGHGDEFSQALSIGTYHWVIVPGADRLAEDNVVRELDVHRLTYRDALGEIDIAPLVDEAIVRAVRSGDPAALAEVMINDLQMATLKLSSDAKRHMEFGESFGALAGITLATTSAIAMLGESRDAAMHLQEAYHLEGIQALLVSGPVPGAQVVERHMRLPQLRR